MADAAIQAFAWLAVAAAQLDGGLRYECVFYFKSGVAEGAHHIIVFGADSGKHFHGTLGAVVAVGAAVGVYKRYGHVYYQRVDGCFRQRGARRCPCFRGEIIVCAEKTFKIYPEQISQRVNVGSLYYIVIGIKDAVIYEMGKRRDAPVWEVLRAHA